MINQIYKRYKKPHVFYGFTFVQKPKISMRLPLLTWALASYASYLMCRGAWCPTPIPKIPLPAAIPWLILPVAYRIGKVIGKSI